MSFHLVIRKDKQVDMSWLFQVVLEVSSLNPFPTTCPPPSSTREAGKQRKKIPSTLDVRPGHKSLFLLMSCRSKSFRGAFPSQLKDRSSQEVILPWPFLFPLPGTRTVAPRLCRTEWAVRQEEPGPQQGRCGCTTGAAYLHVRNCISWQLIFSTYFKQLIWILS